MSLMVSPVLADTPTAGESTNIGIVLQGALVEDYTISGGRPVGKSFEAQTTTTMQASTIGVEYLITQKESVYNSMKLLKDTLTINIFKYENDSFNETVKEVIFEGGII